MEYDERTRNIIDWRESFITLDDKYFFELLHTYLGEIKTPYNKQKLIENLSSFLRDKENVKRIISYITDTDFKILTAIRMITCCDIKKLEQFFESEIPVARLYDHISSLEERLLIFSVRDNVLEKKIIRINPLLLDAMEPFLDFRRLVSGRKIVPVPDTNLEVTELSLAAFLCFIENHSDMSKNNGELKKKTFSALREIFENSSDGFFQTLFSSLRNLSVLRENSENPDCFSVNWDTASRFAQLSVLHKTVYLCSSAAGHFTRKTLTDNASLFLSLLGFMRGSFFTRQQVFEAAFMLREKKSDLPEVTGETRFSRILSRAKGIPEKTVPLNSFLVDCMIDAALSFGAMVSVQDDGVEMVGVNEKLFSQTEADLRRSEDCVSIDAGFTVTVMPSLTLAELIPLIRLMEARKYDVAAIFEITKNSLTRGFSDGLSEGNICGILEKYSGYALPQNLLVSVSDWKDAYDSARLYKGYVLKLTDINALQAKSNPVFSKHIMEELSPNVFLLDFETDADAKNLLQKLWALSPDVKKVSKEPDVPPVPFMSRFSTEVLGNVGDGPLESSSGGEKTAEFFRQMLEGMEMTSEQRKALLDRINRHLVVNESQLNPKSIRFEIREAAGMDFSGKVYLIENSIENKSLVSVEIRGEDEVLVGVPLSVSRKNESPTMTLEVHSTKTETRFMREVEIALISRIRKIRKSELFDL